MTQRPIVFLDIDGTLLPLGPGDRSDAVDDPSAWRARSNPRLGKLRRAPSHVLLQLGAELVWATAWGQDANDVAAPILALGRLPVVNFEADDLAVPGGLHWKTAALVRYAAGRPFVWLDDEIRDLDRQRVEAAHPSPALLHRVSPTSGLTEDDLAVVKAWVDEVAGPPLPDVVPPPLRAIMDARYDYDDGRGVAFEPYPELEPVAETGWWLRHWTGNPDVTGEEFRPFGQDSGGGYVCSWMIHEGMDLVDQPVVYLGSDGDVAVLAADAWDALWFFAHGFGPHDVPTEFEPGDRCFTPEPDRVVQSHAELTSSADRLAPGRRRPMEQIVAEAAVDVPDLRVWVDDLSR